MSEKRYAVVLGRNYTSRLGMIRAVGQAGYPVVVVKTDKHKETCTQKNKIDAASKYVVKYFCFKEPDDAEIIDFLQKKFQNETLPPVLLPTDDYTASLIDSHIDVLRGKFLYPSIQDKQGEVVRYMDKALQKELAKAAGLNVVEAWTATWNGQAYDVPEGITFPCFLKPEISFQGSKHIMKKCGSREELEITLRSITKDNGPLMLEQFVDIEKEYDIPGLSINGNVVIPGIIEKGMIFLGVTGTGRMLDIREFGDLKQTITEFVRSIGVDALIDLELYQSGDKLYFNELNLRFGASGFSMMGSGVNLPAMLVEYLIHNTVDGNYHFAANKTFASEKVCFQKYSVGQISWKEYRETLSESDFLFVQNPNDPKPGSCLNKDIFVKKTKKFAKRLLK